VSTAEVTAPEQPRRGTRAWAIVAEQEIRDLWIGGRGLVLVLAFSLLLSVISYLTATNTELNFLEQRESLSLVVQVALGVGSLLALLGGADALSGERERGTLESLLLTPASRLELTVGKLLGALSLWVAAFIVTIPYAWFLGRGVDATSDALAVGAVVGTLLALFVGSLGILISIFTASNRVSLALALFLLLALYAPTQLPATAQRGWAGELLLKVNPVTAGEHFVGRVIINDQSWGQHSSWLISPAISAALFLLVALLVGARFIRLRGTA
jgi:ABC-2 type transport system permease protein